jgi:hypothetical protein
MKFIFMLLILFVLTDPVMAKPANNTSECLQMYGAYMIQYGASKHFPEQVLFNFADRCLPAGSRDNSAVDDYLPHQKLLRIINNNNRITTVKA